MSILTKLEKEDFEAILGDYSIGRHKSHKHISWALGNTIYILNTVKGKYVLKIFESSDNRFIDYQIRVMNVAERAKIPVPNIIKTKAGKDSVEYRHKRILIQEFVSGVHPKKLSDRLVKDIAHKQAILNKALLKIKRTGKYTWGMDYYYDMISYRAVKGFDIRREEENVLNDIKKINKKRLRKSVLHGDFQPINLIAENGKLKAILDWDDCHEDYLIHDLVTFIAHSFVKPKAMYPRQIKLYLKEYQKVLRLDSEERKAIYHFIKLRYLSAVAWLSRQIKKHADTRDDILKNIRKMIRCYMTFSKMTLQQFLNLVI